MSALMPFFEQLGERVEAAWRAKHFDEAQLHEVAAAALAQTPPSAHVQPHDIIDWALSTPQLPWQMNAAGNFGDPPIQVFSGERFLIEALFWVDGSTALHEHSFSGAFHVLAGSSLHSLYGFESQRRISNELELGVVQWQKSEVLTQGSTRPILLGRQMIHALFHLDRPSVTIVVRTFRDLAQQLSYLPPGVAYAPTRSLPQTLIQHRTLLMLQRTDPKAFALRATRYLEGCDFASAFLGLLEFAKARLSNDVLGACIDILHKRDAGVAEAFEAALYAQLRGLELIGWRSSVIHPELRFALALLLNFPGRSAILAVIAERYPEGSPSVRLVSWLNDLSGPGSTATPGLALSTDELATLEAHLLNLPPTPPAQAHRLEELKAHRALDPLFEL